MKHESECFGKTNSLCRYSSKKSLAFQMQSYLVIYRFVSEETTLTTSSLVRFSAMILKPTPLCMNSE